MAIITCPNCGTKNRVDQRAEAAQPVCGKCGAKLEVPPAAAEIHPVTATEANFSEIVSAAKPVLVDFWAVWCPPCGAIAPVLDELARQADGRYVIAKLNVDENPGLAQKYQIDGIPTMLFFKNGQLVDRIVGAVPKRAIEQKLAQHA
jgi:thioredoxin